MKTNFSQSFKLFALATVMGSLMVLSGCGDDPEKENVPELITKATLTFTPVGGGAPEIVIASDPDLDGPQDIVITSPIELNVNTTYDLSITLINELAEPIDEEYNITAEVEEEGDEHQFFFAWTGTVFSNPTLSGNIFDAANPSTPLSTINYLAPNDVNGRSIGLNTRWTTAASAANGTFTVTLMHQPDGKKTSTSNSSIGESDLDLTFTLQVQ